MRLRRLLRFSLLTCLIATAVVAVLVANRVAIARRQLTVIDYVGMHGGRVVFDYEISASELQVQTEMALQKGMPKPVAPSKPGFPDWALNLLGEKYFRSITELSIGSEFNPAVIDETTLVRICSLPKLRHLHIASRDLTDVDLEIISHCSTLESLSLAFCNVGDAQIERLAACKNLESAVFNCTSVTANGVARLEQLLPGCRAMVANITTQIRK